MSLINIKALSQVLQLQKTLLLKDFPSGSSLEFYNDHIYIIGDDATNLLVLDANYNRIDSITLFKNSAKRIPKARKVDLEASATVRLKDQPHLLMLGSASTNRRERALITSFTKSSSPKVNVIRTDDFFDRISKAGIKEVNIEGAAIAKTSLLLANRGNNTNAVNHLISTSSNFLEDQEDVSFNISRILLDKLRSSKGKSVFIGISGLAYVPSKDILLFTASTEDTDNAVEDGAIGNSYLGWITDISSKLNDKEIKVTKTINLNAEDKAFKGQKIESVCVEKIQANKLTLHLVSDNDNGQSRLFKVQLTL